MLIYRKMNKKIVKVVGGVAGLTIQFYTLANQSGLLDNLADFSGPSELRIISVTGFSSTLSTQTSIGVGLVPTVIVDTGSLIG